MPVARVALVVLLLLLVGCAGVQHAPVTDRSSLGYNAGTRTVYVVKRGDTLYSIAFRHGLNYRDLARWNRIGSGYTIYPGQKLRLVPPPRQTASRPSRPSSKPPAKKPTPSKPKPGNAGNSSPSTPIKGGWQWPADGTLARQFSASDAKKKGIEIRGKKAQPVFAAQSGRVVYSGSGLRGYGNLIIIKHNTRYLTAYGYNEKLLVKEGDSVKRGETIARMGLGPHRNAALHFELRVDGKPVDPVKYLPKRQ